MSNVIVAMKAAELSEKSPAAADLLLRLDAAESNSQVQEALNQYDRTLANSAS